MSLRCRLRAVVLAIIGLAVSMLTSAAAQSADSSNRFQYAELSKAPEKDRARKSPLENDPSAPLVGRKLFLQHCAECHGPTAEGSRKAPSLQADEVQQATPGTIFWILTNGVVRRGMPVWSKLPEPQRWQLVTYIKSLKPAAPASTETK